MRSIIVSAICLCFGFGAASAAEFDGSKPMLCALRSIVECVEETACERVTPSSIDAPTFIRLNLQAMTISGTRPGQEVRTSKIRYKQSLDGQLILQGADDGIEGVRDGLAWSVIIGEFTGEMVMSASGYDVAFVVFGACILP